MITSISVSLDDGRTLDVRVKPVDLADYEEKFGVPSTALGEGRVVHVLWVTWRAAVRQGLWPGDFESFKEAVADIPQVGATARPTPPAPSDG